MKLYANYFCFVYIWPVFPNIRKQCKRRKQSIFWLNCDFMFIGNPEFPKVYLLAPPESSGESVTLTCYVKDFYPKEVAVSWLVNDKQVEEVGGYEQNTTAVIDRNNLFSVYSQLIIKTADWNSGSLFSCLVYHESIKDCVRHISRSIAKDSKTPTLVNLTLTNPQSCSCSTY